MDESLIIPDECVPFIRLQRSRFKSSKGADAETVKTRYAAWVLEDFKGMEPYFPAEVNSILEIGCGVAALQVFVKRKFPHAHLSLLDGNGAILVTGWNQRIDSAYNSRRCTEMLLNANGVKADRWYDLNTKELLKADLIISMASWGFHYPFSTYRVNGFVICDLRRGHADDTIRKALESGGQKVFHGIKYDRMAFRVDD
jgi:hypothetical protein